MAGRELTSEYHPGGYPGLGLAPRTLTLRWRHDASLSALARRVGRWEDERGANPGFELRTGPRMAPALAFEMAQVYVALRERFPAVAPEYLNVSSDTGDDAVALAWSYAAEFPLLRALGCDRPDELNAAELRSAVEPGDYAQLRSELRRSVGVRNPSSAGAIEISSVFGAPRRYRDLVAFWHARNALAERNGRPVRMPALATSPAAMVLVHEFGHLVDAELADADADGARHVYAALSACVFGYWPHSDRQWRYHLWNYPTSSLGYAGAVQGGPRRRHANRQALRWVLGHALTRYAATSRDEVFAEAFALAFCAATPQRRALAPFRRALIDVGMLRRAPRA
jgi:hypothetical protein